mgnify:CR=1 FL=1
MPTREGWAKERGKRRRSARHLYEACLAKEARDGHAEDSAESNESQLGSTSTNTRTGAVLWQETSRGRSHEGRDPWLLNLRPTQWHPTDLTLPYSTKKRTLKERSDPRQRFESHLSHYLRLGEVRQSSEIHIPFINGTG